MLSNSIINQKVSNRARLSLKVLKADKIWPVPRSRIVLKDCYRLSVVSAVSGSVIELGLLAF